MRTQTIEVIAKADENDPVDKLWGIAWEVENLEKTHQRISEEGFKITDIKEGTDITLTYTKPTKPGAYPQTNLKMRRNTSTLLADSEAIPALLDRMPDFDNLFERLSPSLVDAILDEQLSGSSSAESRSSETAKYGATNGKSDVDRAFDELMTG